MNLKEIIGDFAFIALLFAEGFYQSCVPPSID